MMDTEFLGSEIHGFQSMKELDIETIMEEAKKRWLRPNEIHAIISNHKCFSVNIKPVELPKSGTIVLFDRKMLRNFRKDGHNWKKKKDGKTIKEAHEHLKVGNAERIHVYYAHGQDSPTFVRRCYWLLDKTLEHIVLVHYRETHELQGSPVTSVNSNSCLSASDQSAPRFPSEELNSEHGNGYYAETGDNLTIQNHEMRLHEINTLEWDELVANDPADKDKALRMDQNNQLYGSFATMNFDISDVHYSQTTGAQANANGQAKYLVNGDRLQSQDGIGKWMNYIVADSPVSVDDAVPESSISSSHNSSTCPPAQQIAFPEQLFVITDISLTWAFSNETTKVLVTGYFQEQYLCQAKSNLFCVCGEDLFPLEFVQTGVYRCFISASSPGIVNLYLSLDGYIPISQVLNFEYRNPPLPNPVAPFEDKSKCEEFQFQLRLAHLLFSSRKQLDIINSKVPPTSLAEAKKISHRTSHISDGCAFLMKLVEGNKISYAQAKDSLLEITLKNVLKEWLLERVVDGHQTTEYDAHGLGVIHLCAILGYTWAVPLYLWSGLSLNFRDKHGWAALHWAAYYGREKMVAALLSAGANAAVVTDPTSKKPGGCSPADLAAENGYDGLAAYLSEKALVGHFEAMTIAGNVSGSLQSNTVDSDPIISVNQSEEQILKDTLAAYRTAANAAAQIQSAFRERSLKVRTKAAQLENPETEARNIVAAMRIQQAFRNYEGRKKMMAAVNIQYRFRTWKIRKEFLNLRRQAIKIQAAFRGLQARKQYHKFVWSVGVLEKAVLRWRLKRKGFRGFHVKEVQYHTVEDAEEGFYIASQKQAEERIERSVIRVQALFRSKKAQLEYRRMKLAHIEAKLEYEALFDPTNDIA